MIIKKYEVWYNYSTYLNTDNIDLMKLKDNILKTGLGELVFHSSNNMAYWINGDEIISYDPKIIGDFQNYKFSYPKEETISKGQREYFIQAVRMKGHESNLFRDYYYANYFEHIRIFLAPFYLQEEEFTICLYPQIKVYRNGIVQVVFRRIGKKEIDIDKFILKYVNLYSNSFKEVWVPSGVLLTQLIQKAFNFLSRKGSKQQLKAFASINNDIKNDSITSCDTFKFSLNKLPTSTFGYTTKDIFDWVMECIIYCVNTNPKFPFKYKEKITLGETWKGMPVIHLLEYSNQPHDTKSFSEQQSNTFLKILCRTSDDGYINNKSLQDLREFDDYSIYLNEALILCIMSKKGLDANFPDVNNGHLVYDKQIQAEMLNYYYIISRKLFDSSVYLRDSKVKDIIENRLKLHEIEHIFKNELANFGETKDMLNFAEQKLGIKDLKEKSHQLFELKKERNNILNQDFYQKISVLFTILFGLIGTLSFAKDLVVPVWDFLFKNNNVPTIVQLLNSYCGTVGILLIISAFIFKRIRIKNLFFFIKKRKNN